MAYSQDDLLQLSALQHLIFCPRQCALIHIEGIWGENQYTAEGAIMHERVDSEEIITRRDIRVEYAMPISSLALGLSGKADVVEFHLIEGCWIPFPVEYKRGKAKGNDCDRVQLCAQAMSLEEMLDVDVPRGALFYGKARRRTEVAFDSALRDETKETARRLHALVTRGVSPRAKYSEKCKKCSLLASCMPEKRTRARSVKDYLAGVISEQ